MEVMSRPSIVALLIVVAGCGIESSTEAPDLSSSLAEHVDLATSPRDLRSLGAAIGDPCTAGACLDGLVCRPIGAKGYCTSACGSSACPTDARCMTADGESWCFKECDANADCQPTVDSIACSPHDRVCTASGIGPFSWPILVPGTNDGAACVTPNVPPTPIGDAPNVRISEVGHLAMNPAIAVAGQRVALAWLDMTDNALKVAVSDDDGATFAPAVSIAHALAADSVFTAPSLAADSAGRLFLTWTEYVPMDAANHGFYVATSDDDFTSSTVREFLAEETSLHIESPRIALAPDGAVVLIAAVTHQPTFDQQISYWRSEDAGSTWSAPLAIGAVEEQAYRFLKHPSLAFDAASNAYIVWSAFSFGSHYPSYADVNVQKVDSAGVPDGSIIVLADNSTQNAARDPATVTVAGSTVVVGYLTGDLWGHWDLQFRVSTNGVDFLPPVKVNDDATCATHFRHAMAAAGGKLHALYYDNRYLVGNVFLSTVSVDESTLQLTPEPSAFVNDESFPFSVDDMYPNEVLSVATSIAASSDTLYTAWTDPRDGVSAVYFSRLSP